MHKTSLVAVLAAGLAAAGVLFVLPATGLTSSASGASSGAPNPDALWAAQSHEVLKLRTADGSLLLELPVRHVRAMAADPLRGTLWTYGRSLRSFRPDGQERLSLRVPRGKADNGEREDRGRDSAVLLAVNPGDAGVWLAREKALLRVSRDGEIRWRAALAGEAEALAWDDAGSRLWVAQGKRLAAFAPDGARTTGIKLKGIQGPGIRALAYAPALDALWVAGRKDLLRLSPQGAVQYRRTFGDIRHLAADHRGGLWLAGERTLRHLDSSGLVRFELSPFPRHGPIVDLAASPADGSAWIASPQGLVKVAPSGEVLERTNLRGPGHTGRVWALALFADITPPELEILAPESGAVHATRSPGLRFAYRDLGSGVDPATLAVAIDGEPAAVGCDPSGGTAACTLVEPLAEGKLTLIATVADRAGNTSEKAEVRFAVDVTPPVITVETPPDGAHTNQSEIALVGTVTDNVSGVAGLTVGGETADLGPRHGFSHTVTLPSDGEHTFELIARDAAGNAASRTWTLIRDTVPPPAAATGKIEVEITDGSATVTGAKGSVEAHATVTVTNTRTGETVTVTADGEGRFSAEIAARAGDRLRMKVIDRAGNASEPAEIATSDLPPDPADVAPEPPATGSPPLAEQVSFLYTGSNPIQEGVEPGTIEPRRVAVLRGEVRDRAGEPLPGVTVTVLNHPELGRTRTRADGLFDLVVNGGATLTVVYAKEGYLPVQRRVPTQWRGWFWAGDVVMTELSDKVTPIDLTDDSQPFQVAQGEVTRDADGRRRATLLFPAGTTAEMTLPDGTAEQLSTLDVRATEYTVGEDGPEAMPGELPPASAYTYAVELSVDQVRERGEEVAGEGVRFSQPVPFYVDNFLDFPTGGAVPVGYYNRDDGRWEPYHDGRIVEILAEENGRAVLDVTGDGQPATAEELDGLGITEAERAQLAELYDPGKSLWRMALRHLSSWDANWPWRPIEDAKDPDVEPPETTDGDEPDNTAEENECPGCTISPQKQAVGESIAIAGSPYSLHYRSDRAPGFGQNVVNIPLTAGSIPDSLMRVELTVEIAGRRTTKTFPAATDLSHTYTWDGRDAYERKVRGGAEAQITVSHVFPCVHRTALGGRGSGGGGGSGVAPISPGAAPMSFGRTRPSFEAIGTPDRCQGFSFDQKSTLTLTSPFKRDAAVAGNWSLDRQHSWDSGKFILIHGDGGQRKIPTGIITTAAGTGQKGYGGDGGPATEAQLWFPEKLAVADSGDVYIADPPNHRVRRVTPGGRITTVAGTGEKGFSGDGGPATDAEFRWPRGVAVDDSGNLYIADTKNHRIRKVDTDGIITTVVGKGTLGYFGGGYRGDGGPASEAYLSFPKDVAITDSGTLYIADFHNNAIRKVNPKGIITTIAGTGDRGYSGDGGPAQEAELFLPSGIAITNSGGLLIADSANHKIRKVFPDGSIDTVAGVADDRRVGYSGDGGPATAAELYFPTDVTAGAYGGFCIADKGNNRIRRVTPNGTITTLAGNGEGGFGGDGGPANEAQISGPRGVTGSCSGGLYIADTGNNRIRKLALSGAGEEAFNGYIIPSELADALFLFDPAGRHSRTEDARTGEVLYSFERDAEGRLTAVTDGDGNTTTIERDAGGRATAIIAPDGQRTELTVDDRGHLTAVTGPGGAAWSMAYTYDGLLTRFTDPGGDTSTFAYNENGRLVRDAAPEGGGWKLARSVLDDGYQVTMTSGEGRTSTFTTEHPSDRKRVYTREAPGGTRTRRIHHNDGNIRIERPDGTRVAARKGAHPQFGLYTPVLKHQTVSLPSGLERIREIQRDAELAEDGNPTSLTELTRTITTNGRAATATFDAEQRQWTATSPAGRTVTRTVDGQGRTLKLDVTGLAPLGIAYDDRGRPSEVTQTSPAQSRTTKVSYFGSAAGDQAGYLKSVTDPLGRTVTYTRDGAGRVTEQTLPGGRSIGYRYDAEGKLTALTPPGRSAHVFVYNGRDNRSSYTPPDLAGTKTVTRYTYNRDQQLTSVERPGGGVVDIAYDSGGRRSALTLPAAGTVTYGYNDQTGQLDTVNAPGGQSLSLAYDGFLPTKSQWSGAVSGSVTRTFDNNFWVTGRSVNGTQVGFAYDEDGLLTAAGDLSLTRDPGHGLVTATGLAGITGSRAYNPFGELTQRTVTESGTGVYEAAYTRDKLGRIQSETETVGGAPENWDYTYDEAGRLTRVTRDGSLVADYTYDANGNRTKVETPSGTVTADYDPQDRLTRYGSTTYTYNQAGDLTGKTAPAGTTTYTYDALGNLRHVELASGKTIDYVIDGANRRVGKKVNGTLVQGFLYKDQLNPVAELDGSGNVEARFVYGAKPNVPAYMIKGGTRYRIISDHLGSVRLVINTATGAIAQRMAYGPFGQVTRDTNPGFQPFGFAGGIYDRDTGLVRFGARDYDPEVGRWTAKDPILFSGGQANLYGYVVGDPVNSLDPNGMLFGFDAGESYGESSAQYWARKAVDPSNAWYEDVLYNTAGVAASLWTPCTSNDTASTLLGGGSFGALTAGRLGAASIYGGVTDVGAGIQVYNEPTELNIAKFTLTAVSFGAAKSILSGGSNVANRGAVAISGIVTSVSTNLNVGYGK